MEESRRSPWIKEFILLAAGVLAIAFFYILPPNKEWIKERVQDYWKDFTVAMLDDDFRLNYGANRPAGVIHQDYMATSELGTLGSDRDFFDTYGVTAYIHRITFTGAATLRTIRRQLVRVA